MPDLGDYQSAVLWSYAAFMLLLGGFLFVSIRQRRRVRAQLNKLEKN